MKKKLNEMTAREVYDCLDKLGTFQGRTINLEKARGYKRMENIVRELKRVEPEVRAIRLLPPEASQPNGMVCVDLGTYALLERESKALLVELLSLADYMATAAGEKGVRLSFSVMDVWEE